MEQGSLRCDANVSLMPTGTTELGLRTETKNVNSLRSVERALTYEICRQAAVLAVGGRVQQETRHWHEEGYTTPGRSKEQAEDYRYFPEPDLVPIAPSREWVEQLRATLPELPHLRARGCRATGASPTWKCRTWSTPAHWTSIEATVAAGATPAGRPQVVADRAGPPRQRGRRRAGRAGDHPATGRARCRQLVDAGTVNDKLARQVIDGRAGRRGLAGRRGRERRGLAVVSDDGALAAAVDAAIAANPDVAARIRDGKLQAAGALIGAVMKEMRGQADAARVRELILAEACLTSPPPDTDGAHWRPTRRRASARVLPLADRPGARRPPGRAVYLPGRPATALSSCPGYRVPTRSVHVLLFAVPVYLLGRLTGRVGLVAALFAVHAVVSELIQWRFIPYRDGDPWDARRRPGRDRPRRPRPARTRTSRR